MRRLILARPKWSSSRMRRASATSMASGLAFDHGRSIEPVEVVADHAVFRRGFGHALEALELLPRLVFGVLRHLRLVDLVRKLGDLDRLVVAFAQLLLDVLELLPEDVLALLGGKRRLRLFADLPRQLQHLDALADQRQHLVETLLDVEGLQHRLLFRRRAVADPGDEVGQRGRGFEAVDRRRHFGGDARQQLDHRPGALAQQVDAGLDLRRQDLRYADLLDAGGEEGMAGHELDDAKAAHALADGMMGAVGCGDIAQDAGHRADPVQLFGLGVFDAGVGLEQDADHAFGADRLLGGGDRRRPADGHRHHHAREQHRLADRQDGDHVLRERRMRLAAALGFQVHCFGHVGVPCAQRRLDRLHIEAAAFELRARQLQAVRREAGCAARTGHRESPGDGRRRRGCRTAAAAARRPPAPGRRWRRRDPPLRTPGRAAMISSSRSVSKMSTGGSQFGSRTDRVGWKNCRCSPSARSIIAQASAHIHLVGSFIGRSSGRSRRIPAARQMCSAVSGSSPRRPPVTLPSRARWAPHSAAARGEPASRTLSPIFRGEGRVRGKSLRRDADRYRASQPPSTGMTAPVT